MNNGTGKEAAIVALQRAIDHITESTVEKLVSVETRITNLKQSIATKTETLKSGLADLVKTIDETSREANAVHAKIDQIEDAIEHLPSFQTVKPIEYEAQEKKGPLKPK